MKLSIKSTQLELSEAIKADIEKKLGNLDKYYDRILDAQVEVEKTSDHHRKGDIYRAEINVSVPGDALRAESLQDTIAKALTDLRKKIILVVKKYKEKKG